MYPNHYFYHHPYDQTLYDHSTPYQTEHYIPEVYDQRSIPNVSFTRRTYGTTTRTTWNGGPSQGFQSGPPSSPPPSFVPAQSQQQQVGTFAVDPGSIRGCLFRYTYVWLNNRQQFWYYPTFVGRTSISGWRWTGFNWVFFGVDLRQIQSFTCV